MSRRLYIAIVLMVAALTLVLAAVSMNPALRPATIPGEARALAAAEVRSYRGEDLSSVNDFHENSILGPQYINESDYHLSVTGLTLATKNSTYREILASHRHYTKVVTLHCVEGWDVTILWEGVLVRDLISEAGIDPRANTVIFHARDGYTTVFPLSYFMNNDIIMAYKMNNVTLPDERGYPFELVAEDKWGYKWIKWIEEIELSDNPGYKGYWEQRGFSISGDLDGSHFSL